MSSSSTFPQWKPDVFVSFGEGDVIKTFISNLFKRLNQVGINYFEDDHGEGAGQKIAIPKVRLALIVFSTNYVNSSPRLEELVEILNCKWDPELVVIPIFYIDGEKVSEFANVALATAKKISGHYELKAANSSSERNLIDKIVGRLFNEIHCRYSGNDFTFGPFGSKGKNDWKSVDIMGIDGRGTDRKGIDVEYGYFIKSITFKVPEATCTKPRYGKKGEDDTYKVKLEDGEYITSFAGSKNANNRGINSLTFRTNKRILGPIGREEEEDEEKTDKKDKKQKKKEEEEEERKKKQEEEERRKKQEEKERKKEEEYFSMPSDAGEVIEFFWRKEGNFLESVGARVRLHSKEFYPFPSVGLLGKEMGREWDDESTHANVRKIIVRIGQKEELDSSGKRFIRYIEFHYEDKDEMNTITVDGRDEYLTSISRYYTDVDITSLMFLTNKQMAILIGEEKGIYFSSPAMAGKIVGFYRYIQEHLCEIGAYFEPILDLHPVKSIGPFGGGCPWDDGKFDGVREIHPFVKDDTKYIHGIKFVYDDGSVEGHQVTYGYCTGDVFRGNQPVLLDYPREYLTSISGYMQKDGSISSLTFYSNKRRFLNGKEGGTYFWYPSTGSRILGFYGTWGMTLNFIGVYVEPIPHLYPFKTIGRPIKGSGGTPWDDGVHTNVRGFRVTVYGPKGSSTIESITFMYDDKGSLVEGSRHGGGDASSGKWVMLDLPEERLTRIEGYMRVDGNALDQKKKKKEDGDAGQTIIHDLIIVTTKETPARYAPRDDKNSSTKFAIPKESKDGRIVGFFGMAGTHLNSIGARLEPYLIVGVLKKEALIHGRRLKKNEDKKLQAFNEEELLKHEGKECQQRSLKSSPRIAKLVYCIGFVCVLLLT